MIPRVNQIGKQYVTRYLRRLLPRVHESPIT